MKIGGVRVDAFWLLTEQSTVEFVTKLHLC